MKTVGTITLPEDPAKEYLARFQDMATGTTEGPEFYVKERDRLDDFLEMLSDAEFPFTDVPSDTLDLIDHMVTKAFQETVNSFRFDRLKKKTAAEVKACRAELDKAFGKVFVKEYEKGDVVFFSDCGQLVAGIYMQAHTFVGTNQICGYMITPALGIVAHHVARDDLICKAERSDVPLEKRKPAVVFEGIKASACGEFKQLTDGDKLPVTIGARGPHGYSITYSKHPPGTHEFAMLKAAVLGEKELPHQGPYR